MTATAKWLIFNKNLRNEKTVMPINDKSSPIWLIVVISLKQTVLATYISSRSFTEIKK
jgi:hypothetical protein